MLRRNFLILPLALFSVNCFSGQNDSNLNRKIWESAKKLHNVSAKIAMLIDEGIYATGAEREWYGRNASNGVDYLREKSKEAQKLAKKIKNKKIKDAYQKVIDVSNAYWANSDDEEISREFKISLIRLSEALGR